MAWVKLATIRASESIDSLVLVTDCNESAVPRNHLVDHVSLDRAHILSFIDEPGFMIGSAAEKAATIRHGTNAVTVEIPGGMVDAHESAAQAAARELEEETGFEPGQLFLLGSVEPNPAFLSNTCWTYLALRCTHRGHAEPDPTEEIEVRQCSLAEFTTLIEDGTIRHALVIAAHDHLRRALARNDPSTAGLEG